AGAARRNRCDGDARGGAVRSAATWREAAPLPAVVRSRVRRPDARLAAAASARGGLIVRWGLLIPGGCRVGHAVLAWSLERSHSKGEPCLRPIGVRWPDPPGY